MLDEISEAFVIDDGSSSTACPCSFTGRRVSPTIITDLRVPITDSIEDIWFPVGILFAHRH